MNSFKEFLCHLVMATRLLSSDTARQEHLAAALTEAATVPTLKDQIEAIQMIADVAETVSHLIETVTRGE